MVLRFADHSNDSDVSHSADMDTRAPNIIGCLCVFVSFLYFPQVSLRFYPESRHFLLFFSEMITQHSGFGRKIVEFVQVFDWFHSSNLLRSVGFPII